MRDFLVDTQTVRYWYDKDCRFHAAVVGNIEQLAQRAASLEYKPKLLVSVITLGEIEFGHRVTATPNASAQAEYAKFVSGQLPARLELSEETAGAYGELRARLFNRYAPGDQRKPKMRPEQLTSPATALALQIQENDLWLAAQALAHGTVLVTNDRMTPITTVAGGTLLIQNWTIAGSLKIE